MGWNKREVVENFVVLGDEEGQKKAVGGILTRLVENRQFSNPKTDYEFVDKTGELQVLSGSASLARQIGEADMGKFFKATFEGWGKSANGKFKQIAVYLWEGEPDATMKAWPKFSQYYTGGGTKAKPQDESGFDEMPDALKDDDDDLPF